MKLNIRAFAIASAVAAGLLFTLCALLLALVPSVGYVFFSFLFHIDLSRLAYPMSWGIFFAGLVTWVAGMWLAAAGVAWLYNRLAVGSQAGAPSR
ncbi:MAG: hypothetical protein HY342_08110 [Candidatus Lambdaproteobacteria bacterium]|nr:hypothetical protein [Candidatus Lambdaproteobacteria bacterium]